MATQPSQCMFPNQIELTASIARKWRSNLCVIAEHGRTPVHGAEKVNNWLLQK